MKYLSPTRVLLQAAVVAISMFGIQFARSETATFTLDPGQSQVTISGNVAGNSIREQGSNSLTTSFSGAVKADLTESAIQFSGGSTLDAAENGSWQPMPGGAAGTAPADYGALATSFLGTITAALRDIVLDLTSQSIAVTSGSFPATNLVFSFPVNSLSHFDYNAGFLGSGSRAFAGNSTNQTATVATLTTTGGNQVLRITIDTTFTFRALNDDDSSLHLAGQLVATRALSAPAPRISSITEQSGMIRIEADGADTSFRLESTTDFVHRDPTNVTPTSEGAKTVYTVPKSAPLLFFQLVKD